MLFRSIFFNFKCSIYYLTEIQKAILHVFVIMNHAPVQFIYQQCVVTAENSLKTDIVFNRLT